jgi:hypothetical protein
MLMEQIGRSTVDRRGARRHASVLLVGRVAAAGGESACVILDLSRTGLKARFTAPPSLGERLVIEARGLGPAEAEVRWVSGVRAGLAFAEPQDIHTALGQRTDRRVPRPPRFAVKLQACLRLAQEEVAVEVIDISAGGAKLTGACRVEDGAAGTLVLRASGLSRCGTICWTDENHCGFHFADPLPVETLSGIVGRD